MDKNAAIMFEVHEIVVGYSIKTIKKTGLGSVASTSLESFLCFSFAAPDAK